MPINHTPIIEKENDEKKDIHNKKPLFFLTDPKYSDKDVIWSNEIRNEVDNLISLEENKSHIFDDWGLAEVIKGNRSITANLYGESGTGKTMTAHVIAEKLKKRLLIVDYAEIESKYVGETSKNLVDLFKTAKEKGAVILFDEADALLSKRVTSMQSATDVSVNQTRNVLLKLLDDYDGVVIFTTNFISNYDKAFFRRILCHIKFSLPDEQMRIRLWRHYLVDKLPLNSTKESIISKLCKVDGLSGSDITNIVLRTAVKCAKEKKNSISEDDLMIMVQKVLNEKHILYDDNYQISTRKVTREYVQEKLGREVSENGD